MGLLSRLRFDPASLDPDAFLGAVDAEARRRLDRLLAGIERYRAHPYRRRLAEPPALWAEGTTRLLDYRPMQRTRRRGQGPALIVVPSLINRSYILDLTAEASFLRHLAGRGLDPFLVDWGAPGERERGFSLSDYVAGRLERALDAVARESRRPVVAVGYCMGGLLAVALAARRTRDLAGLVCLATPWDFHAGGPPADTMRGVAQALDPTLRLAGELPVDALQWLFSSLDPMGVIRKFAAFAALDPTSKQARRFVALEDWLNDGVALAAPVARECLVGWYADNLPARDEWCIGGRAVVPAAIDLPALVVLPDHDRIVPPPSAAALADRLPRATRLRPAAGHIGMVVGGDARRRTWDPVADWLHGLLG